MYETLSKFLKKSGMGIIFPFFLVMGIVFIPVWLNICLFPALVILLSFIPFYKYDLTEERFEEIKGIIRKT